MRRREKSRADPEQLYVPEMTVVVFSLSVNGLPVFLFKGSLPYTHARVLTYPQSDVHNEQSGYLF